jgi:hypothetical protein
MAVGAVEGEGLGAEGRVAALFDRPSRRCIELDGKIKTQDRIHSGGVAKQNTCSGLSKASV